MKVIFVPLLRAALALVLAYAGSLKIASPDHFAESIERYDLIPPLAAAVVATYLPWLEIVVGIALFVPRVRPGAAAAAFGLCLLFVATLSSAWIRNLDVDCGCFGPTASTGSLIMPIVRALGLALCAAVLVFHEARLQTKEPSAPQG